MTSPSTPRAVAARWLRMAGACGIVATLLAPLGALWWPLDLLTHFPAHTLVACFAGVGTALLGDRWLPAAALPCTALQASRLLPLLLPGISPSGPADLRIATHNVHTQGAAYTTTVDWITRSGIDVLCLPEVDTAWLRALETTPGYRVAAAHPRGDNFGIAVLVREGTDVRHARTVETSPPQLALTITAGAHDVALLAAHTVPPVSMGHAQRRDDQIRWIADWFADQSGPAVLCGDLNLTRWSSAWAPLAGLTSAREGQGYLGTWPAHWWIPGTVPIDHLVLKDLTSVRTWVGPDVGSDHLPLLADVVLSEGR